MVVCNDWHSALVPMLIHAEKTTTGCWKKQQIYVTSGCVKPLVSVVTLPFLKVIYHDSMALPDHFHWICGGSHFETGCKESPLQGIHATFSSTWLQAKTGEQHWCRTTKIGKVLLHHQVVHVDGRHPASPGTINLPNNDVKCLLTPAGFLPSFGIPIISQKGRHSHVWKNHRSILP